MGGNGWHHIVWHGGVRDGVAERRYGIGEERPMSRICMPGRRHADGTRDLEQYKLEAERDGEFHFILDGVTRGQ